MKDDGSIIREKPKKKNNMQRKMIVFLVIVLIIFIAVPAYFVATGMREEEFVLRSYQYAEVGSRTFVQNLTASGVVQPVEKVGVESRVGGDIINIFVSSGQKIAEGEKLMELDTSKLETDIDDLTNGVHALKQEIETLETDLKLAQRGDELFLQELQEDLDDLKRKLQVNEQLYEMGRIAANELKKSKNDFQKAELELEKEKIYISREQKKSADEISEKEYLLAQMIEELDDKKEKRTASFITAPFSGRIVSIKVEVGDSVNKDMELLEMADMNQLIVELTLSESDVERIFEGQEAEISVGREVVAGYVSYISSEIKSGDSPSVEVKTRLEEIPANLRLNARAEVRYEIERREDIPYLPRGTYLSSGEYSYVFIVEGSKAYRTDVAYGQYDGNYIEVRSGLEKGDKVITSSYEDFKEKTVIDIILEGGREFN
ncbi:MAG: efflux RND transporter periplasmic adaptor subunit [bacterium]